MAEIIMTEEQVAVLEERFGDHHARLSAQAVVIKLLAQVIDESSPGTVEKVRDLIGFIAAEAQKQPNPQRRKALADVTADALRMLNGI